MARITSGRRENRDKWLWMIGLTIALTLTVGGFMLDFEKVVKDRWTFEETLPGMQEIFGANVGVLRILAADALVTYEIIAADGAVHTRRYYVEVTDTFQILPDGGNVPAQGRTRRIADSRREATHDETEQAAKVLLGQLDPGIVTGMWQALGFPTKGNSAILSGGEWQLSSGARPFDRYAADFDGSNLRQTQRRDDIFGKAASRGSDPVPAAPQMTESFTEAQRLSQCVAAAKQDVQAMLMCVEQ